MKITIIILVIAALCAVIVFFLLKQKQKKKEGKKTYKPSSKIFQQEDIVVKADIVVFTDVVAYFKNLSLTKGRDIPFIAKANSKELQEVVSVIVSVIKKTEDFNDTTLLLGTLNEETNEFENVKIIIAKSFDDKTKEVLGNEPLVVLN